MSSTKETSPNTASPKRLKFKHGLAKNGDTYYYKIKVNGVSYSGNTRCHERTAALNWVSTFRQSKALRNQKVVTAATFDAVYDKYFEVKATHSKGHLVALKLSYEKWIQPLLGKKKVQDLTRDDLDAFSKHYLGTSNPKSGKPHSKGGLRKQLGDLRAVVNFAVDYKLAHPLDFKIKQPKEQEKPVHAMNGAEARRFLAAADTLDLKQQHRVALWVMVWMGLRISEVRTMRWNWFSKNMTQYTPGQTKGREASLIPVHPVVAEKLRAWRQESDRMMSAKGFAPPPTVFYTHEGTEQYQEFVKKDIRRCTESIGIGKNWTNHDLRRTCASVLHEAGTPILQIQLMMRHKDVKTTLRYIQKDRAKLIDDVSKAFTAFMEVKPQRLHPSRRRVSLAWLKRFFVE